MRSLSLLLAVLTLLVATPSLAGVTFRSGSYDDALAAAKAKRALLFVEVFAGWCEPCKRQAAEVFDAPAGAALTRGLVAWRVDFDAPAQRALMERWNVLSLPTVLVLRPDGTEVDRIEGDETKEAFLAEAQRTVKGLDALPVLEQRLLWERDSSARLMLTVDVAHRRLVRGDPAGARMLERVTTESTGPAAEEALFLLGRWQSRVKCDFAVAKGTWRELLMRFPDGMYAGTAAWWYASALHELGEDELAVGLLDRRARATWSEDALGALVSFAAEKGAFAERARVTLDDAGRAKALDDTALATLRARLR